MPGRSFRSALVLSGGSARGLAHLGVLEKIERRRIEIDLIVGTSMGAIIGALFAYYRDSAVVIGRLRRLFESELFLKAASAVIDEGTAHLSSDGLFNRFLWFFKSGVYCTHSMLSRELVPEHIYHDLIATLIPDALIEDLPIPFAAIAMDLATGDEIVITRGPLRRAVAASAAIPGMFPVVPLYGRPLIDGGWTDNVPVAPAIALGAHFVMAVDTTVEIVGLAADQPQSAAETLFRCNELTRILLTRHRKTRADILITPELGQMFWADFGALDRCMAAGRNAFDDKAWKIARAAAIRRVSTLGGSIHPVRSPGWRHPFVIM